MSRLEHIKSIVREPYAWPGGYPRYAVCSDGAALCPQCVKDNFREIAGSTFHGLADGWCVDGIGINWEDTSLLCEHCGEPIESAYGEGS